MKCDECCDSELVECDQCDGGEPGCLTCDGDGEVECPYCMEEDRDIACETCNGKGEVTCAFCDGHDDCEECETGRVPCPNC
jgi:prepilin-type processing-associated H-X9-DG protein